MVETMFKDVEAVEVVDELISTAQKAQQIYAGFSQKQVDHLVAVVSQKLGEQAEKLAIQAHEETGFGNVKDKIIKNTFASEHVYNSIKDIPTVGEIKRDDINQIIEIGIPMGIVVGLIPSTNPTSTVIFKALLALKSRNAIIFSPHPKALKAIMMTVEMIEKAIVAEGAPAGLIQVIKKPTLEATQYLMQHDKAALILATGGGAMVKAAYQSGTPAIGVGQGNAPTYIEKTANVKEAVAAIIESKTFDYGTICASEQSLVVDKEICKDVIKALEDKKAYFLSAEEAQKVGAIIMLENGGMNPAIVGKPAVFVAKLSGIEVPEDTSVLIAKQTNIGKEYPFSREKLTPVLGFYTVETWEEGMTTCNALLANEGAGHTAILHTQSDERVLDYGLQITASRVLINTLGALGAIGFTTKLAPSLTLGCGAIGGSSTTDNVSVLNLLNIKRIAYGV